MNNFSNIKTNPLKHTYFMGFIFVLYLLIYVGNFSSLLPLIFGLSTLCLIYILFLIVLTFINKFKKNINFIQSLMLTLYIDQITMATLNEESEEYLKIEKFSLLLFYLHPIFYFAFIFDFKNFAYLKYYVGKIIVGGSIYLILNKVLNWSPKKNK